MRIMTVAATLAAIVLSSAAFAGGDLTPTQKELKQSTLKFRVDSRGSCIQPLNWVTVQPYCPPGWVKIKARVSDLYWKKCETKSWYASTNINGIEYCTQRFRAQEGEFCAPQHFTGRFWHRSKYDGHITEFNFKDNIKYVVEQAKEVKPIK